MSDCRTQLTGGLLSLNLLPELDKIDRLLTFVALLEKWNKAYNLTAIRNRRAMISLHLLDSLAIMPYLHGTRMIDIGTGAGLPGIPLAIYAPEKQFVLIDSNSKKTRFVQQAIMELKLRNASVCHSRAEIYRSDAGFDTVMARAFAPLPEIVKATRHLLAQNGILLAMTGREPVDELAEITTPYTVHMLQVPGIDVERCVVEIAPGFDNSPQRYGPHQDS
jgi:16S rRNA (guanine527-N7)-methyltransferase